MTLTRIVRNLAKDLANNVSDVVKYTAVYAVGTTSEIDKIDAIGKKSYDFARFFVNPVVQGLGSLMPLFIGAYHKYYSLTFLGVTLLVDAIPRIPSSGPPYQLAGIIGRLREYIERCKQD